MRRHRVIYVLVFVVAMVLLLGCLALWVYLPASGKSSKQIAVALLEYHNLTQTNGLGYLGADFPDALELYNQSYNNSHPTGPDYAEATYSYDRLGIYFERTFILSRDFPGGNTWTLTSRVMSFIPIIKREYWWTQQCITIAGNGNMVPLYNDKNNSIASDVVLAKSLAGSWHVTEWASANGWNEDVTITTNGNCTCIENVGVGTSASKWFGTVLVENGFLIMTTRNAEAQVSHPPHINRQRIVYADDNNILLTLDTYPAQFLFRKQR